MRPLTRSTIVSARDVACKGKEPKRILWTEHIHQLSKMAEAVIVNYEGAVSSKVFDGNKGACNDRTPSREPPTWTIQTFSN